MNNFFINPNSVLSQEEKDFRINQRLAGQPETPRYITDVVNDFLESVPIKTTEDFQKFNVQNLTSSSTPILPNASQINLMSTPALLDLKRKIEFQKKNAISNQFTNAYDMTLMNINTALAAKTNENTVDQNQNLKDEVASNPNDNVILASTDSQINTDNSANPNLNKNAHTVTADAGANTGSMDNKNAADGNIDQSYTSENLYETDNETVGIITNTMNDGNTNSNGETDHQKSDRLSLEMEIQKQLTLASAENAENIVNMERERNKNEDPEIVKNQHLEKIRGELESIMPEMDVPKELMMLKFGSELLKARSNRRGKLPRFLDELGQALTPVTDTMMALSLEKQKQARELGGMAYEIYREEKKEAADLFTPNPAAYADVLTVGYDADGKVNGQVEFYKSILSPGEAQMYMGMVYPEKIGGKDVPANLVGKPIFRLSDKLVGESAAGQTFFDGPLGADDGARKETLNMLGFILQGANTASEVLSIGDKHHAQGQNIFGLTYEIRNFGKMSKDLITEGSQAFQTMVGINPNYAEAIAAAPSRAEKELIAYNTAYGTNLDYAEIVNTANTNYKELQLVNKQNLDNGFISQEQFLEGQEALNDLYNEVGMFSSSDISILPILQTNMTFSYARYIQGSNRLLKDVIRSAGKIVKLDGFFNTDRKVMNRYNTLLDFFVNEYNQELLKVFSPKEIEKNGYALQRDGSSIVGGYNIAGTINTANTYSGAGDAINNMDINNELEGFLPNTILDEIL
tara:strand:+ start:1384 stop:3624 length:2241 start_codon:yes stop_codon:yes gene_type:complete